MVNAMQTEQGTQIRMLLRSGQLLHIGVGPSAKASSKPAVHLDATQMEKHQASTLGLVSAFAAIYLIWGSTYLGIRYAIETIPPLLMMAARHFTAGIVLYGWLRLRGTSAPKWSHWRNAAVAGGFFFLGSHGSLAWAEQKVPSGLAALLCATLPLWIVLLSNFMGSKRDLSGRVIAGLLLGFAGVAILIGPAAVESEHGLSLIGAATVLLGAFLWAAGTMYTQGAKLPASTTLSSAMQMVAGGIILFLVSLATGEGRQFHFFAVTLKSAMALAYLMVFGSLVAFTAFTWLHKVSSPTRNSTYAYVNPVVAVFLGWLLAGEAVGARTLIATAIILSGVALVNRAGHGSVHPRQEGRERRMVRVGEHQCSAAD